MSNTSRTRENATENHLLKNDAVDKSGDSKDAHFRVGTLIYNKRSLFVLFAWLLWGDFCFTLMETVIPSVLPLSVRHLGGGNVLIGLLVTTIPSALNFMVNPVVSFRSDRYRSKWGRRIPFLLWATPFITLFLLMIGCSSDIGRYIHTHLLVGRGISSNALILGVISVGIVCFQFFNMFVASVYYYLFNDVVPEAYLGRFMALFRVVGSGAGSLFSFFIFRFAETNAREIFVGAGLLYFVTFMVMCLKIKEGEYPPPPENIGGRTGVLSSAKTYFSECFTHRFYLKFFLSNAAGSAACCINVFYTFFILSLGLTLGQYGKVMGIAGIVTTLLLFPAGILVDRFHPLRVMTWVMPAQICLAAFNCIYLFVDLPPRTVYLLIIGATAIIIPAQTMYYAAQLPLFMRILPKERYGQFCAANAMICSMVTITAGIVAGLYLDRLKAIYHGAEFFYRFIPVWQLFFHTLAFVLVVVLYRHWQKLGGIDNYVPPKVGCAAETADAGTNN